MMESQSPLIAFRLAEPLEAVARPGHYDADAQVWVGDTIGAQYDDDEIYNPQPRRSSTFTYTYPASGSDASSDED